MPNLTTMTASLIRATGDLYFNLSTEVEFFGKIAADNKQSLMTSNHWHAERGELLFRPSCSKFFLISEVAKSQNIQYLNILPADHLLADIQTPDITYRAHLDSVKNQGASYIFAVPLGHPFTTGQTIITSQKEKMRISAVHNFDGISRIPCERIW